MASLTVLCIMASLAVALVVLGTTQKINTLSWLEINGYVVLCTHKYVHALPYLSNRDPLKYNSFNWLYKSISKKI